MKKSMLIVVGLAIFMIVAICPLPMMLGISGIVWRTMAGVLGCCSLVLGIYKKTRKK